MVFCFFFWFFEKFQKRVCVWTGRIRAYLIPKGHRRKGHDVLGGGITERRYDR